MARNQSPPIVPSRADVAPPAGCMIRPAHDHLLSWADLVGLEVRPERTAISAIRLYDDEGRYLFAWIINAAHLLFYVRKPALKLAPLAAEAALAQVPRAKRNNAGEITIRIETLHEAQALTDWLWPDRDLMALGAKPAAKPLPSPTSVPPSASLPPMRITR